MVDLGMEVRGHVSITKRKGNVITGQFSFPNVVLHYGVTEMIYRMRRPNPDPWELASYFFLGTDDTPSTLNDPGLLARSVLPGKLYHDNSFNGLNDDQNGVRFAEVTMRYAYAAGEATGTWLEFGVADTPDYSGTAFNRALMRDSNGVPNALVVDAEESLDIAVTFRISSGITFAERREMYISQERGNKWYTIEALPSNYWSSSKNQWKEGYPGKYLKVLDENGNPLIFNTGPWPNYPINSDVEPDIAYTYSKEDRSTTCHVSVRDGINDVYIGGFLFGPDTGSNDWMYKIMFDEPLLKTAYHTISFELTLAMQIRYPESPWGTEGA